MPELGASASSLSVATLCWRTVTGWAPMPGTPSTFISTLPTIEKVCEAACGAVNWAVKVCWPSGSSVIPEVLAAPPSASGSLAVIEPPIHCVEILF